MILGELWLEHQLSLIYLDIVQNVVPRFYLQEQVNIFETNNCQNFAVFFRTLMYIVLINYQDCGVFGMCVSQYY